MRVKEIFVLLSLLIIAGVYGIYMIWPPVIWSILFFGPLILLGYWDLLQKRHSILRNYPVLGHFRYMLEVIRPEIMQYFVETDTEGRPIPKILRSLVYQRAKKVISTEPFGTQLDVYATGYEWMAHSIYAKSHLSLENIDHVTIGSHDCKKPYSSSLLNISAMSFGALSQNAIMSLNLGAKIGHFSHNTGEGGLSPYHMKHGGDLTWQIGTGYFGCRTKDGQFDPDAFKEKATIENVK